MRRFQTVVFVSLGTSILILCTASTIDCVAGTPPKGLPPWFEALDTNKDGQISLREWLAGGKTLEEFRKFDLNDDGLITAEEVLGPVADANRLKLVNGQGSYQGNVEESTDERYHGKKSFKILTIRLQGGRTYQIEQVSQVYFAFLVLEGPDGKILDRNDSGGNGRAARIVHRATVTGTYSLIATSQGGFRTGAFSLSVSTLPTSGTLPKGLPPWFEALDTNHDGQVSLREWLAGGKTLEEFRKFDLNDDGLITREEVLPPEEKGLRLKLVKGQASYTGALEEATDEQYRSKRLAKILTIRLEAGKTYQIDHKSRAFDAYLYLEGPEGEVLARDDDSGGNLDARIVHRAATTGIYRVIATSINGNGTGPFALTVRVLGGARGSAP